jgi:hypothetical protein
MYPATQTYWLEPTDLVAWGLRRYSSSDGAGLDCEHGYHQALVYLDSRQAVWNEYDGHKSLAYRGLLDESDPRWPKVCQACNDYEFRDGDTWQDWQELIYQRPDTGQQYVLHTNAGADDLGIPSAPPGACWNAWWMPSAWKRPDGIYLMVRLPNGHDWNVDSEASNCTRKGEPHECWVRHGDPRECHVTVDKNGDTCAAGAGSIQGGDYHGFLQNGVLTAG